MKDAPMLPSHSSSSVVSARQLAQPSSLESTAVVPTLSQAVRRPDTSLSDNLVFDPTRPRQARISNQFQPRLLEAGPPSASSRTPSRYPALPRAKPGTVKMMLRRYYWKMETMNVETATRRMKVLLNLSLNGQN
ncbi:hypothetical protein GN244_ATG02315 [Phytophthora infestans]|uniref:Uncharacterized protein n=1 Tax=Phytophthora infestans TaxID=4787 RepID=A0A833WLI9_PHYIN|nr:hypothetical protein GN244_ATG02315 [Phytophthora infestans]